MYTLHAKSHAHLEQTWPSLLIFTGLLSFQGFLRSMQTENSSEPLTGVQIREVSTQWALFRICDHLQQTIEWPSITSCLNIKHMQIENSLLHTNSQMCYNTQTQNPLVVAGVRGILVKPIQFKNAS